jgi:TusA-related sulfurtransferase
MKKILIDAREMQHPMPLQISINHLKKMDNSEYLYMLNQKNPIPLLEVAEEKGFSHLSHQDHEGTWHIIITKNQSVELKGLLDV